jgi:hypothetical protein
MVTCLYILHDVLLLKKFNLRRIPHTLDSNSKAELIALSLELLEVLMSQRRNEFDHIITGKESWFYFEYLYVTV